MLAKTIRYGDWRACGAKYRRLGLVPRAVVTLELLLSLGLDMGWELRRRIAKKRLRVPSHGAAPPGWGQRQIPKGIWHGDTARCCYVGWNFGSESWEHREDAPH
jgi:hypothetical protein